MPKTDSGWTKVYNSLEIETRTKRSVIRKILEEVEGYDKEDVAESVPQSNVTPTQSVTSATSVQGKYNFFVYWREYRISTPKPSLFMSLA